MTYGTGGRMWVVLSTWHKGFESEKVRKKGLLKVLKKVVGKKKDFKKSSKK